MLHCSPRQRKEPLNTLFFSLPQIYLYRAASTHKVPAFIPFFAYSVLEFVERNFFPHPPPCSRDFWEPPPPLPPLSLSRLWTVGSEAARGASSRRSLAASGGLQAFTRQVWESLHFSPRHSPPTPTTQPELDVLMKRPVIWLSGGTPWIYHHQARQQRRDTHQAPTNTTTNTTTAKTTTTTSGIYASKVAGEKTWRL